MPHLFRVDRVRGCLLGLAVGDALGAPLEGLSPQQIKTHYGRVRNYVDGVQAWKRKPLPLADARVCTPTIRSRPWPSATSCSIAGGSIRSGSRISTWG